MFFQNPFGVEFRQSWPIDQQARFAIAANLNNTGNVMVSGNFEPYDFSVVNTFTINIAYDPELIGYTTINVNVVGAIPAATTASEVVAALNANATFADNFTAYIGNARQNTIFSGNQMSAQQFGVFAAPTGGPPYRVTIRCNRKPPVQFYVTNAGAEQKLRFNYAAHVNEMPSYFNRYTVANRFIYDDHPSPSVLIALNPLDPVDAAVITAAGLNPLAPLADWQLLDGRSNTHSFENISYDGSNRITQIIEYFAGAGVGDLARKIQYVYVGASTSPSQITTIPYTLQVGDLVTPP